jgi:hypothetical protein
VEVTFLAHLATYKAHSVLVGCIDQGGKNNEITRKGVQVTPASMHQAKVYMGNDDKAARVLSVHYIV